MPWHLVVCCTCSKKRSLHSWGWHVVATELANQNSGLPVDPYVHTIGASEMELTVLAVHVSHLHGNWPSWPPPFDQHFALTWPDRLQFSHFGQVPVWNTTFGSLLEVVSPCLLLHLVLRCKITTFGSRTPPEVPMMGSHKGVGMDREITLENWASKMSTPNPLHASLNFWSSAMWAGKVSMLSSVYRLVWSRVWARFCAIGSICA